MLLKRHFNAPDGWEARRNTRNAAGQLIAPGLKEGDCLNPPPLSHVEVKHTGTQADQNFSEDLVAAGMREGWIGFDGSTLVLHGKPETLRYAVARLPGYHCLHCGAHLPAEPEDRGQRAREHVAALHAGITSPDAATPAGYERTHAYECVLDSSQHEKFRFRPRAAARRGGK